MNTFLLISVPILNLIPYMRTNVIKNYAPFLKLAITDWNWGNDDIISSAVASAEVLAIFGREGVDMAMRNPAPIVGGMVENAFKMYLNYDMNGTAVEGERNELFLSCM